MKLKMDDAGHIVAVDGKPVYVGDDGKEVAFDYGGTIATIGRLNGEAKGHRERAEAAETRLKLFDGIDDADAARKALGTVRNLDDKKLVDAGEVDRVKAEAIKAVEDKYKPVMKELETVKGRLHHEVVSGAFSRSKFIADKMAVPVPMVEATFGKAFTVEDGKLVARHASGDPIYSRARPGEVATFDEAMEMLVDASPFRDNVLRGSGASGSGAQPGAGNPGGTKAVGRDAFFALTPAAQAAHVKAGGTVTD